jgi:hypothetical protein
VLATLMCVVPAHLLARPIIAALCPDLLRKADENAAKRLSGLASNVEDRAL